MADRNWRVARALSFVLYHSAALWLYERHDRKRHPAPRCTVLSYHRVASEAVGYRDITVAPETFRSHLAFLVERGYRFLTLEHYLDYVAGTLEPDRDCVLITFDDGYRDNFTNALPMLAEAGVPAAVFVCTAAMDGGPALWWDRVATAVRAMREGDVRTLSADAGLPAAVGFALVHGLSGNDDDACAAISTIVDVLKYLPAPEREAAVSTLEAASPPHETDLMMTWEQLARMREAGIGVGAHTLTHPMLSRLTSEEARDEIEGSKRELETRLECDVTAFAYPYGKADTFTDETVSVLREAGIRAAFTTENGRDTPGADPYRLRRNGMRDVPDHVLASRLSGIFELRALSGARSAIERRRA